LKKYWKLKQQEVEDSFSWRLTNPKTQQTLSFTIFNKVKLGADLLGTLISVQTNHGYFELHNCTKLYDF
jgi:hypothetical protein